MKHIEVVAAVIEKDGKYFATQRGYGEYKDWWEFPGGKMEKGETREAALIREIKEGLLVTEGHMDEDLWNRAAVFSHSMDAECGLAVIERNGFTEGDEVIHEHFGNGIIRNIYDGGEYCEVEFFESGIRSLKADKLKKA